MRRTSSRRSICLHPGQNGRCTITVKNSEVRVSRYLDSSTTTQLAKIMVQYGRPSRSSWAKSVWSSFGRTIMGKAMWKSSIGTRLGKSSKLGMFFVNQEKGPFLSVYVDDIKLAGKTENIEPTWKILMKDVDLGEPTSFLDHEYLGCTERECQSSKDIVANYRYIYIRIQDFCEKLPTRASGKLERNLYGHPLAGLLWERQFEKIPLQYDWEKVSKRECLFVHNEKGLFLSVYVDDIKLAGKKQNINPMWKVLNKEVDLGEPTSFLDHVYLGCTQRQCEISKDTVDNYRTMFESRISAVGTEKMPFPQNLRVSSWSHDMEGHAKKCVERYCELAANKTTQQLYNVATPCLDDHQFKEEEIESIGELSTVCSQIVQKCLYLARIGRWTGACDKRLVPLISYIHHTSEYRQYCYVVNTQHNNADRLGLFQDSDFAGDLEDSKSTSGGTLCIFGNHSFVPINLMCKKQTSE